MPELITRQSQRPTLLKSLDADARTITAYVTTYDDPDCVGDIVKKGALDDFIAGFDEPLPMLWMHDQKEIVGEWKSFESDDIGVIGVGEMYAGVSRADDVRVYLAKQVVDAVSIGFVSSDYNLDETGAATFEKIDIREISLVRDPCNKNARVLSAKDDGGIDFRRIEVALRDAGLSRREAKCLIANGRAGLRDAEKITDSGAIVDEFLRLMKKEYDYV